jgi:mannose-6-phosphate isomerase-like protein (cupin superfamily)
VRIDAVCLCRFSDGAAHAWRKDCIRLRFGGRSVKYLLHACAFCCAILPGVTWAQTQPPPAQPPAKPPAATQPPQPRGTSGTGAPRAVTLAVQVTDRTGNPVGDVQVALAGPVERSGETSTDGLLSFRSLRAGTYRLRFEHDGFATFEREVVIGRAGQKAEVSVALSPDDADPPAPEPAPAEPPSAAESPAPAPTVIAEPRTLSLLDFLDKNMVRSSEPARTSVLGCAQGGTARLMQVRDPLENQRHDDVDELVYVIAGEGTLTLQGKDTKVTAGHFALVPRGTVYQVRRQGRNPLIFLSVLAGSPCTEQVR